MIKYYGGEEIMNIDGVFLHYLIKEIKPTIENVRINKVLFINNDSFVFILGNKKELYISVNSNSSHFRLSKSDYFSSNKPTNFFNILKGKLESSVINEITQIQNDRICKLNITSYDDLGYQDKLNLYFELYGRNSNLILTDENDNIIDAYKRNMPTEDEKRIILPKYKYFPQLTEKINPFLYDRCEENNVFEGVSQLLFSEITFHKNLSVINQPIKPTIFKVNNKAIFYCFDLKHLECDNKTYFNTLSEMLEYYFLELKQSTSLNNEQMFIDNYLKKEIAKLKVKLSKQEVELNEAKNNLIYQKYGDLLSSNLYLIKKGDTKIIVNDYYNNNEKIQISLNPLLTANKNLEQIYNKYKKAKRTIAHLTEQIPLTKKDIDYYECLTEQLSISKSLDIKEIYEELNIKRGNQKNKKNSKPNITVYTDLLGNTIFVGKNNIQNNYLTHTLANKNDYFFHVQGTSGSHTILRCDELTNEAIETASLIAAYFSKNRLSSGVAVDYTLVKNIKKVPGTKGSFVTYSNYKTAFATPSLEEIKKRTKTN